MKNNSKHKCSWCGRPAYAQTGIFVDKNGRERPAWVCDSTKKSSFLRHQGNPVFENKRGYEIWVDNNPMVPRNTTFQPKMMHSIGSGADFWKFSCDECYFKHK